MDETLVPIYHSLVKSPNVVASSHIDAVPGYSDVGENIFHFSIKILDGINEVLWSPSNDKIPILSLPIEESMRQRNFSKFDIENIKRCFEPPSIYLCNEFDLFTLDGEESYAFKNGFMNKYSVLFKSWRDKEHVSNNWEFNNVCFMWRSRIADHKAGTGSRTL